MEKQPDDSRAVEKVDHFYRADVRIDGWVNSVEAVELETETGIAEGGVTDERIGLIPKRALPLLIVYPGKVPIYPDTKAREAATGLIFLADVGKVQIAEMKVVVKCDQ